MKKQILLNAVKADNKKRGGYASPAFVAHFANLGPRNIFNKWYRAPGIIVINGRTGYNMKPKANTAVIEVANLIPNSRFKNPQRGRVYSAKGISPCVYGFGGGG